MATSIDYGFNSDHSENTNDKIGTKKKLDFYQSMYHFKKMFPKFDSDVIETVLRSNQGSVDKTLDQLLTMSIDNEHAMPSNQLSQSCLVSSDFNPLGDPHDLPPSYHEIMSSSSASSLNNRSRSPDLIDFNNNISKIVAKPSKFELSANKNSTSSFKASSNLIKNYDQILVGQLSKDFLRIKLNKDQINSFRSSIKIARRDEISALLNNVI